MLKRLRAAQGEHEVVKVAVKRGIVPDAFSAHTLRVTAATKGHENGADLRVLQDWLGPASPNFSHLCPTV